MRNLIHWNGPNLIGSAISALLIFLVVISIFPQIGVFLLLAGIGCVAWMIHDDSAQRIAAQAVAEQVKRAEAELARLSKIPTSTTGQLCGHRIVRQLRAISVDDCANDIDAKLKFFKEVHASGGTGVINMRVWRRKGGHVAVRGDAVLLA